MKGWKYEGYRHSLAARGICTKNRTSLAPMIRPEMIDPKFSYGIKRIPNDDASNDMIHVLNSGASSRDKMLHEVAMQDPMLGLKLGQAPRYPSSYVKGHEEDDEDEDKKSMAWKRIIDTTDYATDTDWDNEVYKKEIMEDKSPDQIISVLESLGVDTEVPDDDVDYYVKKIEEDKENLRVPYVVFGAEISEIIDSGNMAELRAAQKSGLDTIPVIIIKTIKFEDDMQKRINNE
jgi:hypothetical protein